MKKIIMPLAFAMAVVGFSACGGSNTSETSTDSTTATSTTSSSDAGSSSTTSETSSSSSGSGSGTTGDGMANMKESYTDLSSGAKISLEKDPNGYYINKQTRKRVDYYFDAETNDTFDYRGRVVNNAISRSSSGVYTVDEAKVKQQGDGDLKLKSADGDAKVKLETDGDAKLKTDSTKIKIRNGQVKVKDKS